MTFQFIGSVGFTVNPISLDFKTRCCSLSVAKKTFEYSDEEVNNMRGVITSMSLEPTDDARRQRLQAVLTTALQLPNHEAFLNLFDSQLIIIGDECKAKATKAASAATKERPTDTNATESAKSREKTPEELQLWALVDMMIQSKTIVKRAKGELGSSGAFG